MPLIEAKPWDVCHSPEVACQSLLDVSFLAALHDILAPETGGGEGKMRSVSISPVQTESS